MQSLKLFLWQIARSVRPRADRTVLVHRPIVDGGLDRPGNPNPCDPNMGDPNMEIVRVSRESDPHFDALAEIAGVMRVTQRSCLQSLDKGDMAWVALAKDDHGDVDPVAMAWVGFGGGFVRELSSDFIGGEGRCYFYYDFVRSDFRGRGIQKRLIARRLKDVAEMRQHAAYAVIHRTNAPSLRSYRAQRFMDVAQADSCRLGPFATVRIAIDESTSPGMVPVHGWPDRGRRRIFRLGK